MLKPQLYSELPIVGNNLDVIYYRLNDLYMCMCMWRPEVTLNVAPQEIVNLPF